MNVRRSMVCGVLTILVMAGASPLHAEADLTPVFSGTGFFVNPEYIITNEHVVHTGCVRVDIIDHLKKWEEGKIVATDAEHDLAIIHTPHWVRDTAVLRSDFSAIAAGDHVIAVGFPLEVLDEKKDYQVVKSEIIDTQDAYGDTTKLQFRHAIQQGYSGGPLLDSTGKLIGVIKGIADGYEITTMSDGKEIQKPLGKSDEAIKLSILMAFLSANHVSYQAVKQGDKPQGGLDFTINVQCVQVQQ